MEKERIVYLDFIRAISIILIVIFHFNCSIQGHNVNAHLISLKIIPNGQLGTVGVSLFFIISGAALMYTYDKDFSIIKFMKRRFMQLYPMFWIAYASAFLYFFYRNCSINHGVPRRSFLLTIIGMDGYFCIRFQIFIYLENGF